MLTIERVTTEKRLRELEPVWDRLLEMSASDNLMLTFDWLATWWEIFGKDRELHILVAREGAEVIGIAPLLKRRVNHYGVLPFNRLEFLASGEDEADEICSEYLDFIVRRGREAEVIRAFCRYLLRHGSDWDELLLTDVLAESPNLIALESSSELMGLSFGITREDAAVYVELPADFDAWLNTISPSYRRRIRGDRARAQSAGAEFLAVTSSEGFDEAFETLIRLHQERWVSRGFPGVFNSERFTSFHRRIARLLLGKGQLALYLLEVKGRPVAAIYDLIYKGRIHYYQSGLDPEAALPVQSPGKLLRSHVIERAITDGCRECDFMKGGADGYKSGWRGASRSLVQVRLAQQNSKEVLYSTTARVIDGLKTLKRSLSTLPMGM